MDKETITLERIDDHCCQILERIDALTKEVLERSPASTVKTDDAALDFLDVCQILHVSVRHLRRITSEGLLPSFKLGRRRLYLSSEVQQYLSNNRGNKKHLNEI